MTAVATFGPTAIPSEAVPVPPKFHRNFRIEDALWLTLARIAELRSERTSDVMRDLVKAYVNRHRRLIEGDEVLPQRIADLQAERAERAARAASVDTTEQD